MSTRPAPSAAGFSHAPFSKSLFLIAGISTIVGPMIGIRSLFQLQPYPHLYPNLHFWRLFTNQLTFQSLAEWIVGSTLIYHLRYLERIWGSSKFAAFFLVTGTIASLTSLTLVCISAWISSNMSTVKMPIPSGPYGFLYAGVVQYLSSVPVQHTMPIATLLTLMIGQLFMIRFPVSVYMSIGGLVAGIMYRADSLSITSIRIPKWIEKIAWTIFHPLFGLKSQTIVDASTPSPSGSGTIPQERAQEHRDADGIHDIPVEEPSRDMIETLQGMGFSEEQALRALRRTQNNVQAAALYLLENPDQ